MKNLTVNGIDFEVKNYNICLKVSTKTMDLEATVSPVLSGIVWEYVANVYCERNFEKHKYGHKIFDYKTETVDLNEAVQRTCDQMVSYIIIRNNMTMYCM